MEVGLIFSLLVLLPSIFLDTNTQVDAFHPPTSSVDAKQHIYIVYLTDRPPDEGLQPQTYYIKVLTPVLGSEKAAKEALIYSYGIFSGFAAKLNADQASRLRKQPGIVFVKRDIKYRLDDHINASRFGKS